MKNLFRRVVALAGLALPAIALPAASSPLTMEVSHQSVVWSPAGVKQTFQFQEKLVRSGQTVWVERVIPAPVERLEQIAHQQAAASPAHKHLDKDRCAKWITLNSDGSIDYKLVDLEHKVVIQVSPSEYGSVQFDGRWDTAFHLVSPAFVQSLKFQTRQTDGAEVRVKEDARQLTRIVWDANAGLPRYMLYEDKLGIRKQETRIAARAYAGPLPWTQLSGFARRELSDYLD